MGKDTQNNLYYFIISFSKEKKSTQVAAKNRITFVSLGHFFYKLVCNEIRILKSGEFKSGGY